MIWYIFVGYHGVCFSQEHGRISFVVLVQDLDLVRSFLDLDFNFACSVKMHVNLFQ